jgi:hypothetical protein
MELDREKMPAGAIYIDHPKGGSIVKSVAKSDDAPIQPEVAE